MSTRTISTLEELKAFRDEVNAGNTFKGETIELANDIDLGGEEWTPIGHYQGGSFNGTFNGNGHTIKGLNIGNQSYSRGTGFFGETFTAVIKDLTIEGNINTNTDYVGGIVGHGYATITNCNFIGSIRTSLYQVGGIAGSGGFTITNCTVDGNISGASWVGGIVGNCQDGGAYTNCYVKGEISADSAYYGVGAAGIAAIPLYTSQAISNCYSDTVTKNGGKEVNAPIIGVYNNTVTADTKTFLTNNSWNKEKNSNDTFGICGGDNADPTVPVNNVSRSNNLIAVASDLLYVEPGTLTIAHGTSLTQEEILDTLNNTGDETKGAVVDPDGTIRFVNYVASINGTKYETLEAALAAAQDGDTITLLSDISLDQTLTIDKTVTIESAAGSAFTIKAGPSMTATKFNSMALLNIKNAGVSLKNLTLDGNGQSGMTLIWTNQATGLTLDTCTLQNSRNAIYAGSYNGGTVKINNCSIIAQIYAINGSGMDKIEVTDSKLYGWTSFNSANAAAEALFRNCFFGAGDDTGKNGLVAALRPYFNAVVEGCTFTEAFSKFTEGYYEENGLSLGTPNAVMDLTNCKIVTETGDPSTLALAKLISTKYDAAAGNAKPNTAFAFDAVKDENGKYISGIFCGDSEVITKNLAAGLAAVANEDGTYTPTAVDMSTLLVNEKWAETYKVGDLIQEGFYFGVNAFAKANDAINAAGANATIKIQDAHDYNTPITKASYTENLTIESQENSYSQLYMTVSGTTYTYGEEDENGNAVRHDATVEYKGQDIFFGGHSHFESLAGMTVKFTNSEITHEGGTPFFKVYGDSNVVFDGANYANENGNLWFYVSGQLDLLNDSTVETEGGSGFRILAAGGKVNVDNRAFLRVLGSNISIGSYYVYGDKTAKAVVGGKKQGHDADGNNDYSATLNITNGAGLVNNGIVRVGASYILDNATTDELEGLTITDTDKPANYADLAKAYLNITDASAAELDRLYVDGNGAVTIRNSTLTANSITLADGSSLTLDTAATVTVGALTAANGTITIDASSYTSGLYKLIDVTGYGKVDYSKILTAFGENLTVIDNDLWIGAVDRSTILVDSSFAGKYNAGDAIVGREGFFYGFNAFATAETMFDNIHDTTTTLKFFGEQELITDAATGAANNRNFNIRAKQDLTLTADEAAKLTLTVKDSSWEHGGSTNNVGELAFLSDSDDAVQTITIGENVTIDTNAKIWFGRTAVTKEVHATNVIINGSIIQKPHKDATSEHPNASLYGIHQIQVEKGSTVTLNGSMLFGWSLLVKGGTFNVTENASLTWDVDAFAQTNGNVEVESRQETGGQFNVSGSKNVNLRSLTIKDGASSASFTNGAEAVFIDYITLVEGSSITVDAASTVTTGTLTNNGTITIDATGVTSGSHKVIDTDAIAGTGSIIAKDGTLADDMNLVIADNDVYVTDQKQDVIYVGGVNAAGEKSANTAAPAEALQGWNKFDTMKDAFKAGALGNNTIDFGNAGRVVSDKAFIYTPETIELGKGEYTITNGAGAYLPRLTMNSRDVVVNIKKAHLTLSKYRSGKDSNGELGGASLNITDSRVDGGNEVDGLMWVTSYADSTIEITNSRVGLRDSYTGEAENVTLGNTGNYLDWGSYGNLALKVSGTALIKDSTIFAGYYFNAIGDADGATIDVTNSVVYASAVETDGTNGLASLSLHNSALRQSGWGNGSENYNFLVKKGATVSLTNGSNLWWARAAQVRVPYSGELCDSIVIDNGGKLELFYDSTAEVGNITNNGELVIYESTLKAMTITNNNYFAINNNSAITAEFSAAGTGFITVQDAAFGADTVINSTASYTNQGIGSEIVMFGENLLANGANISTGWSKNLRIGFGTNFPSAAISITSGAKLTVGGSTYIGSATEDQGDAAYWVLVTGAGSEFNGSGASGDLYLRADGMLTIQNEASASFSYFNGKGVLNVLNATFKALNFNIADSGKLSIVNGAKVTLGSTTTASTARGDISVGGDETELNLIGDIKYGRTNTAANFTVKNNATVTVDGNIELGYFTQVSGVMFFYKSNLSLTNNTKFTTTETIKVFLNSAIAMDYTSRLTFGGLTAQNGAITIDVSGYTDGIYKVMENTGSNAVDYTTVISNWSEIENIGYTILDNSLYIGKADAENYLVNATYSKYKFGDAIEGKTGYFYGFNAFSSLDDAGRAAKEATKTITVEADLTEDVNTPLFDLKGDLILTAESPVTVTWNVIGNAADAPDTDGKVYLVSKDGLNHTFTIGENVTLNVPQSSWGGAFYVGYQSAWATKLNIDGKVNTYLFYIGSKSEVTISETGSLTTTSENLIMRWDSKLTVNGNGTLDENNPQVKLSYASIQGGDLVLNNTVMNAGSWLQMWNRNKVDGKQAPTLTLDNSILIASGLTANDAEEAVISLNNNSTVKINGNATNAGTMSVTDSVLYVDETLTNSGTINVYGESSIKTTYVSNTGMIILNDGTTLVDSTIMDSTENTVAYGNVTVRDSYFGTLVFSGNSGASVNGTLEGAVYVDDLMVDRRYNNAVSEDITGTLTVKADANIGVSKHMYNKVGSTTVIEANATVTVIGELQNKGTFNVEGYLYLFSENGLGESVAGRDKNKGVMNVNGGKVHYADSPSSNGWFGIGAKIHNAGWEDVQEAGSEMNLSNNALLDLTFNGGNEYPGKYGAAFAIGTGATLNVESGSTVNANSALLNKGTVNLDETSKITVGDLINEATGKISVKAGKNVSFKAGALTNNGEFAVDGGSYQGGTVKVIDLDSINGAEIIVNNIDSKYVYRGDDGDVLFSDASKEILKGNTSWSSIAFGDAVTEAGTDFYKGVNAFDNGTALWAQFEENVTTEVEIGAGDFTDGNATSASHRFIGGKNVVIRSTAAGDDYAVLSKDSTFEYGVADEATIDADYTITLEGNQQYDWLQVRAAQKDWQTGSTEAGKQIKLNADGTAQAPAHLITLNVNGKVIAKTLNVKEGTLINIDASKGGSLTGNGNGGGGYVVRGMMNVIGKNGTDFDSEATLNLNGAAFTVGYAPNSSKVRGPAFVNITDKAVVTNIMHSFLNFQAPGSILNVDNAKLDVGHIQEATAGNASCDFTFNVKNKADVHAKNSIVLGQDAQNGDDGIFSFNVENSTVAADWNIELKTFSDTTLSTSKMSAAKDFILNGNLSMQNDSTLTVGGNFTNTGSISVGSGSSLDVGNTFINRNNFNLNWNASLKMGSFDATSSSITIDMTGFDNKEHALVVVNNTTLDETAVISIVGQNFYDKYKGYLRYDGNTLYLTENLSAEVYVSSSWAGKGQGETVDYNGNTYTIGTNAFGTVEEAKAVNPLLIHIVDGTISKTALEAVKTVLEGDATYTGVITAGTRVNDGVDNRRTVDGDTNVTVNSGTFKSNLIGADSQISGAIRRNGNVTLTINGGNFEKQIAGGMYFYAQNPFDEAVLVGDVNMTINGGTFDARVYGGNFAYLDNEFSAQTKLIGDINLTINATNEITFNEHVTAGSRGTGRIYGDINVKITGEGSKLNFTGKLIGDSNAGGFYKTASGYGEQTYVSGDRIVEFANFQGDFNAELLMFKTLNFSEGTNMTFTSVRLDVSNVSEWNFGFGTELNINAGLNSFEGDALAFELDGWDNSSDWTAINGAKDSMIAGWDKAGSVSFFLNGSEYAASWDAAAGAWCSSELGVKLGLGDDQKSLLIGKLA